ncbi:uracil-DNA glycosylase family protein [Angustibacter sp. McL0619]|uniref:uracil-DNA glycosylase family protein n=1 Tax=Angustibacter sp. McL0619 TaxID=3415676 RepID=UPI003CEDB909
MLEFDPGPPQSVAAHLMAVPSYAAHRELFWYDWGPVFYRGRLDGSAKLLCIASDPGPTERIAGRTLVGDAGQRVQGFLNKVGLSHSYVLVNAFAYALLPSKAHKGTAILSEDAHLTWRNALLDMIVGPSLQAVVAFGGQAQAAVQLWQDRPDVPLVEVAHPSSRHEPELVAGWHAAIDTLRSVVTPDDGADPSLPNYVGKVLESDYARIPVRDLPFGVPPWLGDDHAGRTGKPKRRNCADRPSDDLLHTLVWQAPADQP